MKIKVLLIVLMFFFGAGPTPAFAGVENAQGGEGKDTQPPVVVELFSSQACAFCPKADTILGELAAMKNVIAMTCHVDYFDVKQGSLAQPFCTQRQTEYVRELGSGTHYTPQMVVNGHLDVVGYKAEKVSAALVRGRADNVKPIAIDRQEGGTFTLSLPPARPPAASAHVWMALIDTPHDVTIAEGANHGKKMTYTNIMNQLVDLGEWDGHAKTLKVSPRLGEGRGGFAVVAQDAASGKILAAGSYAVK